MHHSKRQTTKHNYAKLHTGKETKRKEEEEISSEDEVSLINSEEDEFTETEEDENSTGEASLEGSLLDEEIQKAMENEDCEKVDKLLKQKEDRCKQLQAQIENKRKKENEEKKRRLRAMAVKFRKLKEKQDDLNKTLASSRSSTPNSTPGTSPKNTAAKKKNVTDRLGKRRNTDRRRSSPGKRKKQARHREGKSEYNFHFNKRNKGKKGEDNKLVNLIDKVARIGDEWTDEEEWELDSNIDGESSQGNFSHKKLVQLLRDVKSVRNSNKRNATEVKGAMHKNNGVSQQEKNGIEAGEKKRQRRGLYNRNGQQKETEKWEMCQPRRVRHQISH